MAKRVLFTTMVLQHPNSDIDYIAAGRRMVESYLRHTPHYVLIVTNVPEQFKDIFNTYRTRFIISEMPLDRNKFDRFDYTLKLEAIAQASTCTNIDVVYWCDADLYTQGWDEESFQEALDLPYDVIISTPMAEMPIDKWTHRRDGTWEPQGNEKVMHTHREDRVIYKNIEKLKGMVDIWHQEHLWEKHLQIVGTTYELSRGTKIPNWRCQEGSDGLLMGSAITLTESTYLELTHNEYKFTDYEKVVRRPSLANPQYTLLDRWWGASKDRFMYSIRSIIGIDAYDNPKFDDKLRDIQKSLKNNK